ncbi:hypothetical Protein YC6258_05233 [Gynuella sunshinyii YC6258]|uniref:Uncharacterized protein n=1 Tax=Gynuella sunshinyii YC6258 TaxID=1445510 RepID=A0A0C5W3S7_9GAMM|nr:hypothetical Protein YC6258_05233 [Gynuella sunshinyii YC6258]
MIHSHCLTHHKHTVSIHKILRLLTFTSWMTVPTMLGNHLG